MKTFTITILLVSFCATTFAALAVQKSNELEGDVLPDVRELWRELPRIWGKFKCFMKTLKQVSELRGLGQLWKQHKAGFEFLAESWNTCAPFGMASDFSCQFIHLLGAYAKSMNYFNSVIPRDPMFFTNFFTTFLARCETPEPEPEDRKSAVIVAFIKCVNSTILAHVNYQEEIIYEQYEPLFAGAIKKLRKCGQTNDDPKCLINESLRFVQYYDSFKDALVSSGSRLAGKLDLVVKTKCDKFKSSLI